jgi:hypothetical protein
MFHNVVRNSLAVTGFRYADASLSLGKNWWHVPSSENSVVEFAIRLPKLEKWSHILSTIEASVMKLWGKIQLLEGLKRD